MFPILSLLTAILIVLKLLGLISISWWYVFLPAILSTVAVLTFVVASLFVVVLGDR